MTERWHIDVGTPVMRKADGATGKIVDRRMSDTGIGLPTVLTVLLDGGVRWNGSLGEFTETFRSGVRWNGSLGEFTETFRSRLPAMEPAAVATHEVQTYSNLYVILAQIEPTPVLPHWPLGYAKVTFTSGPLEGVVVGPFEIHRFNGEWRVTLPAQPDYVITAALQDEILTLFKPMVVAQAERVLDEARKSIR